MPDLLERFLPRAEFLSYEDFRAHCRVSVPEGFNFARDVVDERARRTPGKRALLWRDARGREAAYDYADLARESARAAAVFAAAGIRRGDPVLLLLKRRPEFWFCLLGLHRLGAIAIPATHLLRARDIAYRNRAAAVRMIVALNEPELVANIEEAAAASPALRTKALVGGSRPGWLDFSSALAAARPAFAAPQGGAAPRPGEVSLLYFTSGTTGPPKMVAHDFAYPLGHILTARYWQGVDPDGLHFTLADTGWAKAAWGTIYGQWLVGGAVFVYDFDAFVPKDLLAVLAGCGLTSFCAPPTVYRYLIKEELAAADLSRLRRCTVAGEPLNPEVFERWRAATGLPLREAYGQTETTVLVAAWPWLEPRPGSMGRPAPGWDVDVVDETGRSCGPGEEGEVVVRLGGGRPLGLFLGYHRDERATARAFRGGMYRTGDVARRDAEGWFWFVGRADDVIKSSGYRIGPFEVESALLEHPAVLECAVTAVPDPERGQVVKASVVLARGCAGSAQLARELQEHAKRVTAPYKYPRVVEFVSELPKTISGKIRRVEIRERDRGGAPAGAGAAPGEGAAGS